MKPKSRTKSKPNIAQKPKPASKSKGYQPFLVRADPAVKEWLEQTADQQGISRDALVRLILNTARANWGAVEDQEIQGAMFDSMKSAIEQTVERVVRQTIENAPKTQVEKRLSRGGRS